MKLQHGARTDVGLTRDHNEDTYGIGEDPRADRLGQLYIVCDGIGGHLAGEVASDLAVKTVLSHYYNAADEDRPQVLVQAFRTANQIVHQQGQGTMGTTGVAALFHGGALYATNVGDSRAYLIRNNQIRQITQDHSYVQEQVRAGLMTPEQAEKSHIGNIITRAIGNQAEVLVDLFREPLMVGDLVLLCSDGLHGLVKDHEIGQLALHYAPQDAVDRMVNLANERGGKDNITVVLIKVETVDTFPASDSQLLNSLLETTGPHESAKPTVPVAELISDTGPIPVVSGPTGTARMETLPPAATPTLPVPDLPLPAIAAPGHVPTLAPAAPAARPAERRLGLLGALLALLLLLVLGGAAYVLIEKPEWIGLESGGTPTPQVQRTSTPRQATVTVVPTRATSSTPGTPDNEPPAEEQPNSPPPGGDIGDGDEATPAP